MAGSATALMAVQQIESQLRRSASPLIDQFIDELGRLYEVERREPANVERVRTGQFFRISGEPETVVHSDLALRERRLRAINSVIVRVREEVSLEPLTADELILRLNRLRDVLPAISVERVAA